MSKELPEDKIEELSRQCYEAKELFKKCLYGYAFLHFTNLIFCEWLHVVTGVFTMWLFVSVSLIFCWYGLTKNEMFQKKQKTK